MSLHRLTVEVEAEVAEFAANCAGRRMLVPDLVVVARLLVHDHVCASICTGSLHVENEPRVFADDHEILAVTHRDGLANRQTPATINAQTQLIRLPDCDIAPVHLAFIPTYTTLPPPL